MSHPIPYALAITDIATSHPLSLVMLANKYLYHLGLANYSPHTISSRGARLLYFLRWCYQHEIATANEVSPEVLQGYQRYVLAYQIPKTANKLSPYSIRGRIADVCLFFRWLAQQNYILYNPGDAIRWPKVARNLPRNIFSTEEVERIINAPDISTALGIRDRAILELLYSSGIRRREVIELTTKSIDLEGGILVVIEGKGKKDRYVPITERACRWLEKYLYQIRPRLIGPEAQNAFFITRDGKPFTSAGTITLMVRHYINQAGVVKYGATHIFRHTMATLMLENGADVRYIQEILGHSNISSTQIYTKVSITKLKQVHGLTHPANLDFDQEQEQQGEQDE